jgi:hypothetical protein
VPLFQAAGLTSANPQVKASDVATNEFIDPGVGL